MSILECEFFGLDVKILEIANILKCKHFRSYERFQNLEAVSQLLWLTLQTFCQPYHNTELISAACHYFEVWGWGTYWGSWKKRKHSKETCKKNFQLNFNTKNTPLLFYQIGKPLNKCFLVQNGTEIYVRLWPSEETKRFKRHIEVLWGRKLLVFTHV